MMGAGEGMAGGGGGEGGEGGSSGLLGGAGLGVGFGLAQMLVRDQRGGESLVPEAAGVVCGACGEGVAPGKFCSHCGEELTEKKPASPQAAFCTACGAPLSADAKFCGGCGSKLEG